MQTEGVESAEALGLQVQGLQILGEKAHCSVAGAGAGGECEPGSRRKACKVIYLHC